MVEAWVTVGNTVSVRGTGPYSFSWQTYPRGSQRVPEDPRGSLFGLHVVRLNFMMVKHEAATLCMFPHTEMKAVDFHLTLLLLVFQNLWIVHVPLEKTYIHQWDAIGCPRIRHCSAPHTAEAWDATAESGQLQRPGWGLSSFGSLSLPLKGQ